MQLKRPLCVAVLLLCTGLFLVQLTGQKMAEALPKEKEQISLGGRLMQKEEKNGHLLLYLQQVQILSGAVAADDSNTNNKNSNSKMGAVCYLQEGNLAQMPSLGSRLIVCGKVRYFAHAENEGQFDARAYYSILLHIPEWPPNPFHQYSQQSKTCHPRPSERISRQWI